MVEAGRLGAIEAAVIIALLLPIKTHAVRYEMGTPVPTSMIIWQTAIGLGGLALILAALIPLWLAYRIIRKHKNSN